MSHALIWVTGILILLALTAAGQASELCREPAKGFGGVPRGTVLTHEFRLTNPGSVALHVTEVRTSCECSSATIAQQEIPPGGSVPVTVTIHTAPYAGYRTFTIYVDLDKPSKREEKLTVSATSLEDIMVEPGTLNLGRVRPGQEAQASVRIDYRGVMDGWRLTTVDQEGSHWQARFEELKRERGLVQYRLHVKWRGTLPPGTWRLPVYLRTNDPYFPRLTVALEADVQPVLTVTPAMLELGSVPAGTQSERKITLRSAKPFRILRVESERPECTVPGVPTEAKKVHVLTVRFAAGTEAAGFTSRLVIHTDLTEQPRTECAVQAQVTR
jgi:hypothetical protein